MSGDAKPVAEKVTKTETGNVATAAPSAAREFELTDILERPTGIKLRLEGSSRPDDDLATLAKRVKGWEPFQVDGADYPYSEQNAINLLARFHHYAVQVRKA